MGSIDGYVHKNVPFKFNGAELRFDLSQSLFSSFDIDVGSKLLLKTVARDPVLSSARRVLDEGCGVGTIGLSVAKAFPGAEVLLRDRDGLAAAFSERNRLANRLNGDPGWSGYGGAQPAEPTQPARPARPAPKVERGLIGAGLEGRNFDFVLSNLPAKAGAPILELFFDRLSGRRGEALLAPGGRAAVVVVSPLAQAARGWIAAAGLETIGGARGGMHEVFVMERGRVPERLEDAPPPSGHSPLGGEWPLSPYLRCEAKFSLAKSSYRACGFWGLPEFDTPGYGSAAAAQLASRLPSIRSANLRNAIFIEPGAGHLAVWSALELGLERITAYSRDLLALEATGWNLASLGGRSGIEYAGFDLVAGPEPAEAAFDLVAERLDGRSERDWEGKAWALAGRALRKGGFYLVVSSPTEAARLERRKPASGGWTLLGAAAQEGLPRLGLAEGPGLTSRPKPPRAVQGLGGAIGAISIFSFSNLH